MNSSAEENIKQVYRQHHINYSVRRMHRCNSHSETMRHEENPLYKCFVEYQIFNQLFMSAYMKVCSHAIARYEEYWACDDSYNLLHIMVATSYDSCHMS